MYGNTPLGVSCYKGLTVCAVRLASVEWGVGSREWGVGSRE